MHSTVTQMLHARQSRGDRRTDCIEANGYVGTTLLMAPISGGEW